MNHDAIRRLARSTKYQQIYNRAKDLGSIRLFYNDVDFTKLQIYFLHWLEVYGILYSELDAKENYLTEDVLKDNVRTDAYLLYRKQKRDKKPESTNFNNKEKVVSSGGLPSIKFLSREKK